MNVSAAMSLRLTRNGTVLLPPPQASQELGQACCLTCLVRCSHKCMSGLITPIVTKASEANINSIIKDLATRARDDELKPEVGSHRLTHTPVTHIYRDTSDYNDNNS